MAATTISRQTEILFRPYLPWFVIRLTLLLSFALWFLSIALWLSESRWLLGTGLITAIAMAVVLSHLAHAIIVTDVSLICRRGVIRVRESVIPISRLDYEIRQTLPGRLLGYGTVRIYLNGTTIAIPHIAAIRTLQAEITHRQADILLAPSNWRLGP
jgi:membrane protein YdbS with pleckstrin-like domain